MRMYTVDGVEYPSVTTILKLISLNDGLMGWANAMGFKRKDIRKLQDQSTSFGTLVHAYLQHEVYPLFEPPAFKDAMDKYAVETILRQFHTFFKDIPYKTVATEKAIVSAKLGYGGTMDWLTSFSQNLLALVDYKTSKAVNPTMFLQLGAYNNLLEELGIFPDIAGILIINERGCMLHPINREELCMYGKLFNTLFEFYRSWSAVNPKADYAIIELLKQADNVDPRV